MCDASHLQGAWWNADNTIVYARRLGDIMRISTNGGAPVSIVKSKSATLSGPQILPDGRSILYTSDKGSVQKIMVQSLNSGEIRELFPGVGASYLPTGHIVYGLQDNNNLFAVPFDLGSLEVTGGGGCPNS